MYKNYNTKQITLSLDLEIYLEENDIVFCKSFIHNIAKKKYITLQPEFFFNYFDFDNAFLSLKLSPVKLRMCA